MEDPFLICFKKELKNLVHFSFDGENYLLKGPDSVKIQLYENCKRLRILKGPEPMI